MALEYSGFFDSTAGDVREYSSADMERYTNVLTESGVRDGESLRVTSAQDGLNVTVGYGSAMVGGHYYALENDGGAVRMMTLSAPASKPRVDRIVLRRDSADGVRTVTLQILQGTEADAPQAPALTRSGRIYEISLAQIRINVSASVITDGQITDERTDADVCGILHSRTAQDALELARSAGERADTAAEAAETAQTAADAAGSEAEAAMAAAEAAGKLAAGAHYWQLGPVDVRVGTGGWQTDAANDRVYQDYTISGMTAEMLPFASSTAVGGSFPLCGCQSMAGKVRLYMTDTPAVEGTVRIYGMGVKG